MYKKHKIVFFGTPEFAVPSLDILIENDYDVVAVVTTPDKPSGRGFELSPSPVKEYALNKGLKVLQPEKLKAPEFLEELKSLQADIQVVVAFRMLPEVVWNMPPLGTFNLHASLLPQYRGAAPINWAIINGEKETGVTTFLLHHEIDTGDIIFQEKEPIHDSDTVGTLYERLMDKGSKLVLKTIEAFASDYVPVQPQVYGLEMKPAPKIFKETCRIDWNKPAVDVHNFIRGLSPYPAAFTFLNDKTCKIFKTEIKYLSVGSNTGKFKTDYKTYLYIGCTDFYISVLELQLEGKKKLYIDEFLRGRTVESINTQIITI